MAREDQLIERVRRRFPASRGRAILGARHKKDDLRVGIGDDAAVIAPAGSRSKRRVSPSRLRTSKRGPHPYPSGRGVRALLEARQTKDWVITTDAFLENVHFLRKVHPAESVGYKALARATSDIAAMGARGRYFFLTLGLPAECAGKWLDGFLSGMARAARRFGLVLAGGDTTQYPLVVSSLTVVGEIEAGRAVLRSGARPGDLICVSGRLGEAELGLRLVRLYKYRRWAHLTRKHFYPEPRLALGELLAAQRIATAMIDTSDGLSTDLGHICKASGVGARIWTQKIPAVSTPPGLKLRGLKPLEMALHGGEDYELLFTVPKKLTNRLPRKFEGLPLTIMGEITSGKRILAVDERGRSSSIEPKGWDPFRNRGPL